MNQDKTAVCPHCGATTIDALENGALGCSTCFKMWEPGDKAGKRLPTTHSYVSIEQANQPAYDARLNQAKAEGEGT